MDTYMIRSPAEYAEKLVSYYEYLTTLHAMEAYEKSSDPETLSEIDGIDDQLLEDLPGLKSAWECMVDKLGIDLMVYEEKKGIKVLTDVSDARLTDAVVNVRFPVNHYKFSELINQDEMSEEGVLNRDPCKLESDIGGLEHLATVEVRELGGYTMVYARAPEVGHAYALRYIVNNKA